MYTVPEWRRRGVAGAILAEIERYARERGIVRLWLRASEEGRGIYRAAGFEPATNVMERWL